MSYAVHSNSNTGIEQESVMLVKVELTDRGARFVAGLVKKLDTEVNPVADIDGSRISISTTPAGMALLHELAKMEYIKACSVVRHS